jgi:hypothetical protein
MYVLAGESGAEARTIRQTVDQIVHADRNRFDHVWLTERHVLRGFSQMPALSDELAELAGDQSHP